MTALDLATRVKQLSQEAQTSGRAREAEVLDLIAQGFEQDHADILAPLLRSVREAYFAGQRNCAKNSRCFQ